MASQGGLVGGLEHECYFAIYWECHHPNWRTHIFQRGRSTTNQYRKHMVLGGVIIPNPWWSMFFNHQPVRVFSENILNPWCIGLKSQNPQCYMMPFEKKGPQKRVPMFDTAIRYEYVGKSHHIPMFGGKITQRSHVITIKSPFLLIKSP